MGAMKIDTFDIGLYEAFHATIIKVSTSKNVDNGYKLIKIKRNIEKKQTKTFYLKSKHERYLRIAFQGRVTSGYAGVNVFKLNGYELAEDLKGSITSKVSVYQCSDPPTYGQDKVSLVGNVLKSNLDGWESSGDRKSWIIFDCKRFELERIVITFKAQCVPEIVRLKLSDVAPRYSFNVPSSNQWTLKTTQSWKEEEWKDIELRHELTLNGKEYDDGFKRYVMLEFAKYRADKMNIIKVEFFGTESNRIPDDDEQFQAKFDSETGEKGKGKPQKPEFVDSSPTQQGCPLENIWKKEDHFFWMGAYGSDPYLILDLGNNENELESINIKAYASYIYTTLKISTSNKVKSKNWDILIEDDKMESKMQDGGTYDVSKMDVKKYIKLEFFELKMQMFALSQLKLFGNSEFLIKKEKKLTLEDIKNLGYKDEDIISKFRNEMIQNNTSA